MSFRYFMEVHVWSGITEGLRLRGIDVLTAQEDNSDRLSDPELLDRADDLGRILFTMDADHLREAKRRTSSGLEFAGIVYVHQLKIGIGDAVRLLQQIAENATPDDMRNRVVHLSLR